VGRLAGQTGWGEPTVLAYHLIKIKQTFLHKHGVQLLDGDVLHDPQSYEVRKLISFWAFDKTASRHNDLAPRQSLTIGRNKVLL